MGNSNNNNKQSTHHTRRAREATMKDDDDKSSNNNVRSGRRRVNKSAVYFSKYDQVINIPHIIDIPQEEIDQRWMNDEDYSAIRSRSIRLVEMIEDEKRYPISADSTMIVNNNLVCVRGLKEKTSKFVDERDNLLSKLQTDVFLLQQQQREEGAVDLQEEIRQACKKYSQKSARKARLIGIPDEANASSSRWHGHFYDITINNQRTSKRSFLKTETNNNVLLCNI